MEKTGLITLVEKRDTGRVTEKYYRAIARLFEIRIQRADLSGAHAQALTLLRDDLTHAIDGLKGDDSEDLVGYLLNARITKAGFARFSRKLARLLKEYQAVGGAEGISYSLNLGLYPCDRTYGPVNEIHIG
jgi:hypothetical protein